MVIFTIPLPTGEHCLENAVSRLFGGASSWGASLSAVCGGRTTDDSRLTARSCRPWLAGERGQVVSTSAPIPKVWELMSASTRGPASALQQSVSASCAWRRYLAPVRGSFYSEFRFFLVSARRQAEPHVRDDIVTRNTLAHAVKDPETDLSLDVALLGGFAIPTHRDRVVLPSSGSDGGKLDACPRGDRSS
jgi:hypothetical protein